LKSLKVFRLSISRAVEANEKSAMVSMSGCLGILAIRHENRIRRADRQVRVGPPAALSRPNAYRIVICLIRIQHGRSIFADIQMGLSVNTIDTTTFTCQSA
jgi:hypothetical protein